MVLNILLIVALLFILANLFLILVLFFLFFRAFFKFIGEDTLNHWNLESFVPKIPGINTDPSNSNQNKRTIPGTEINDNAQYTPTEEIPLNGEVPLDQFTPNFDKPIKIKYEEEGEDHGLSVEQEEETK